VLGLAGLRWPEESASRCVRNVAGQLAELISDPHDDAVAANDQALDRNPLSANGHVSLFSDSEGSIVDTVIHPPRRNLSAP
jgi:hypothetical protein